MTKFTQAECRRCEQSRFQNPARLILLVLLLDGDVFSVHRHDFFHFLGTMVLTSMLVAEHLLVKARLSGPELRRLAIIDAVYGATAVFVLAAGLSLWLQVGKPADFYTKNVLFQVKRGAFVLLALLSICPTVYFDNHRITTAAIVDIPKRLLMPCIRAELLVLVNIPLLAVLMAHGYGLA